MSVPESPSSRRTPLEAVAGLTRGGPSRTSILPAPPPRRPGGGSSAPLVSRTEVGGDESSRLESPQSDDGDSASSRSTTSPARPATRRRGRPPGDRSMSSTAETTRPITLSLPADLVVSIKDYARNQRLTQPEVLLDALTASQDRFGALVASRHPVMQSDSLFVRTSSQVRAEPMATLSMRLLAPNVDVIDQLVIKYNAPSRSALCAVALRDFLSQSEDLGG